MFIAAAAVLLYYTFTENIRNSAWGVVVIAAGVPVYLYFARKKATSN
jgi:APA family basic amino acid/polyamine antiporter